MSSYREPKIYTQVATASLAAKQFHFVKNTAAKDGKEVSICVADDAASGIVMNAPGAGDDAEVAQRFGGALLKIAGTIAAGEAIKPDADGAGVAGAAGDLCSAIANEDGVSGDIISVDLIPVSLPV